MQSAALIDNINWPQIMGTISGDDTILIICRQPEDSKYVISQIMGYIS